jgi:hypothetical protein
MVMNSLDSTTYLEFYNRVMYMGWTCPGKTGADGRVLETPGCMPVQEAVGAQGLLTGCHPYKLNDCMLRAIGAGVAQDRSSVMGAIMNEATPPMVDHAVLKRLSSFWGQCTPLCDLNVKACAMRQPGVEYVRVACMETPGIPELIPLMCRAKSDVFRLANEINQQQPGSDGAIFLFGEENMRFATGCHCLIDVPQRSGCSTVVNSLRQALFRLGWPGYVPMGDGC